MLRPGDLVIDDTNAHEHHEAVVDGEPKGKGLIPRNYDTHPVGFYAAAPPAQIKLIPRDEYVERIRDKVANKSQTSDIRRTYLDGKPIPSLDQNGQGFCWNYDVTMCNMLTRAKQGQPYVRLSGHANACLIKHYKDEGGWAALALDFMEQNGCPSVEFWKEKSMSKSNDTPAMRENALLHKVTGSWADLHAAVYDRNLSDDQACTLLLSNELVGADWNDWGHSTCMMDLVLMPAAVAMYATNSLPNIGSLDLNDPKDLEVFTALFGKRGLNSWTDGWGNLGEFVRSGKKGIMDGGVALISSLPSAA